MKREEIIGKTVIGSLKLFNKEKILINEIEVIGQIMDIDDEKGIIVCNHDTKQAIGLPIVLEAFKPAEQGYYQMRSGAKIKNPDLLCDMAIIKN